MKEPEIVYTVFDFYDAPRTGVADFQGVPSYFQCLFDDVADQWTDGYHLGPIPEAVLPLTEQELNEWYWWHHAYGQGKGEVEKYPERFVRYSARKEHLYERFTIDPGTALKAIGSFEAFQTPDALPETARLWRVRWSQPVSASAIEEAA